MKDHTVKAFLLRADDGPPLLAEITQDLSAFWGERDLLHLHHPVWLRQFAADGVVVVRADDSTPTNPPGKLPGNPAWNPPGKLLGYLLGTSTTHGLAYVHLIATRHDQRGRGVGRLLYETFIRNASERGARRVEAITTTTNTGSIAFHRRLGFSADVVPDYSGPGQPRVLFHRLLPGSPADEDTRACPHQGDGAPRRADAS